MLKNIITFDKKTKKAVLNIFNKTVDDENYIVEKDNPTQRVLTTEGEEVMISDFAGICKGSEIFIKSDLPSLIKLADKIK